MEYHSNKDAFDKICGNCEGLNINDITEADVRTQAEYYNADEPSINAALLGLAEYQRNN